MFSLSPDFWVRLRAALDGCQRKPLLVGISGPPASGKTTLAAELTTHLTDQGFKAIALTFDGFHYSVADLRRLAEKGLFTFQELTDRRGSAVTFDGALATEKFRLLQGREGTFVFPTFDHAKKDPAFDFAITPTDFDFVMVEGLYTFLGDIGAVFESDRFNAVPACGFPKGIFDFKIRVRCDEEVSRARLIERNGRSIFGGDFEHARVHAERNDLKNGRFVEFVNDQLDFDYVMRS
jgi:pantothenate kinase